MAHSARNSMKYYEKILQPDETVKIVATLHWLIYGRALLLFLAAVVALVLSQRDDAVETPALWVGLALLVLAILAFLRAWLTRVSTEIVVTDRRVIHKRGLVSRHTEEMNVSKVETVDVDQGVGGRIFGYGTLIIRGTGGGWEPLRRVSSPLAVRNAIMVG
jgi:uncharacterized membrane protein YdbT with pleckstrin-like domain